MNRRERQRLSMNLARKLEQAGEASIHPHKDMHKVLGAGAVFAILV